MLLTTHTAPPSVCSSRLDSQSNFSVNTTVWHNQLLWRSAFLQVFDDPKIAWNRFVPTARSENRAREDRWNWYREVRSRYDAFNAVCETTNATLLADPESIVTALLDILETASYSHSEDQNSPASLNLDFLPIMYVNFSLGLILDIFKELCALVMVFARNYCMRISMWL